jgi:hypothetical protein
MGRVNFSDMGGGQNDTLSPSAVPTRQFQRHINMEIAHTDGPVGRELVPRPGAAPLTNIYNVDRLFGALAMLVEPKAAYLLFAFQDGAVLRAYPGIYTLHPTNGFTLNVVEEHVPWSTLVTSQGGQPVGLVCCRGVSITPAQTFKIDLTGRRLLRVTPTDVQLAGMRAPVGATVVTDIGGGSLPDGTWTGAVRFKGQGNNRSEFGQTFTVTTTSGGAGQRSYTNIPVSPDPQCRGREVFLSEEGGTRIFFAFSIEDNTTTIYRETLSDEDFGDEAPETGSFSLPPVNPLGLTLWRGRVWVVTPEGWYPSQIFAYEGFNPAEKVTVGVPPNDTGLPNGVCAWDNRERMILTKTTSVHYLEPASGSSEGSSSIKKWEIRDLDTSEGCASTYSLDACEGNAFWYTGNHVKMSTGGKAEVISDDIQATLDRVTPAYRDKVVGCCDARERVYIIAFPIDGSPVPNFTMAYDWEKKVWYRFGWYWNGSIYMNPLFLSKIITDTTVGTGVFPGQIRVVGAFDNHRRLNDVMTPGAFRDDTTDIHRTLLTAGISSADGNRVYGLRAFLRMRNRQGGSLPNTTVTLSMVNEFSETTPRTVPLPDLKSAARVREFMRFACTNKHAPGSWVALRITLDGHEPVALSGIAMDVMERKGRQGRTL